MIEFLQQWLGQKNTEGAAQGTQAGEDNTRESPAPDQSPYLGGSHADV